MKEYFAFMAGSELGVTGSLDVKPDGGVNVTIWNKESGCDILNHPEISIRNEPAQKTSAAIAEHIPSNRTTPMSEDDIPLTQLMSRKRTAKRRRESEEEIEDRGVANTKRVRCA